MNSYMQILGLMDRINELNEKLSEIASTGFNNLGTGVLIMGGLLLIAVYGIHTLNKK